MATDTRKSNVKSNTSSENPSPEEIRKEMAIYAKQIVTNKQEVQRLLYEVGTITKKGKLRKSHQG